MSTKDHYQNDDDDTGLASPQVVVIVAMILIGLALTFFIFEASRDVMAHIDAKMLELTAACPTSSK